MPPVVAVTVTQSLLHLLPEPATSSTREANGGKVSGSSNKTLESIGLEPEMTTPAVRESELTSVHGRASVNTGNRSSEASGRRGGGRRSAASLLSTGTGSRSGDRRASDSELEAADEGASGPGSRRLNTRPGLGGDVEADVDRASNLV